MTVNASHRDDACIAGGEETARNSIPREVDTAANGDNEEKDLVWYFSYGSNMNPKVFEGRRKINCRDYRVCTVPGYVLTYTAMLPYIEPAFCTVVPRNELPEDDGRPDVHGVAFQITREEYEHVLLTEGGSGWQEYRYHPTWTIGHYGEEEIECFSIEDSSRRSFNAYTLVGLFGSSKLYDCNASQRYCDLVNVGAEKSGLPASYRKYLKERHHPFVVPAKNRLTTTFAKVICFLFFLPCILEFVVSTLCVLWNRRKLRNHQRRPKKAKESSSGRLLRKRFENVIRLPWIVGRISYLWRIHVLENFLFPLLFDWLGLPNGLRNEEEETANKKKV